MAYPPPTLPTNRANTLVQLDNHPNDHNAANLAINDLTLHAQAMDISVAQHEARLYRFQGSSVLLTTDATGAGTVNFLYAFPSLPVIPVTQSYSTANYGIKFTIYAVNVNGFTFIATTSAGTIYANSQVGVHWMAMSMA